MLIRFLLSWGLPFVGYLIAQVIVPLRLHGTWRAVALLPIPVMAYVVHATLDGYRANLSMWPMLLILVSPVALLFLVVLFVAKRGVVSDAARHESAWRR